MTDGVQQRIALVVATIVLAASAIFLIVDGDDEGTTVALPTPSATASVAPSPATSPSPTAGTSQPPSTTSAPVPVVTPGRNLAVAQAPEPGTYTFREVDGGRTEESQLEIADRGAGKQSEEQDGVRADVTWSDESKLIDKITFGTPPQGFECDFAPNIAELKFPLRAGATWNLAGKCSAPPGITVDFTGSSRVTEMARRTVGGTAVDTWRILTEATIRFATAQGSFDQTIESDSYLAPEYGVYVYSVDKSTGTDPTTGESMDESSTKELVSLTPS